MVSILSSSSYILPLCHTKIQNRLSRQLFSQKATKIISKAEDLHLAINTTTSKYCSVAFIRIITLWDSIRLKKWNHLLKHTKRHQRRLQLSSLPFNRKSGKRKKLVFKRCSHEESIFNEGSLKTETFLLPFHKQIAPVHRSPESHKR